MAEEARLVPAAEGGVVPDDDGWFVLNAKETRWSVGDLGAYCNFEGPQLRFPQLGVNLNLMQPGEPMTMYHREDLQEDFLVLFGECVLIVEGQERALRPWDLFHCPAGVAHAIVGAGDGPSLVLAAGARTGAETRGEHGLLYPADPVAQSHGAGTPQDTSDSREAYGQFSADWRSYEEGWLPGS